VGTPREAGGFEYFTMRRSGEEAAVIYRRPAPESEDAEEPSLDGEYEVVRDPRALDPTYRTLISMADLSPDGRLMMYTIRQGGADGAEYRVRDLETGEDSPPDVSRSSRGSSCPVPRSPW
jgi:prolyl oligopeptidase PreP (S9A serine peptidase family)